MGVDMYLRLKGETSDAMVCQIISAFSGVEIIPAHLAIYSAMERVAPPLIDGEASYQYWDLLQENPALQALDHYLPRGYDNKYEGRYALYMGRAHHYMDDVYHNPDGHVDDPFKMVQMLHRQFQPVTIFVVFPWLDCMYWA